MSGISVDINFIVSGRNYDIKPWLSLNCRRHGHSLIWAIYCFFSIQELHLCLNQHTTIDLDPRIQFPEVKTVYLNSNKIHDFREFLKLDSAFPSLEQLVMMENPITALPDPEVIKVKFSNLQ